MSDPRITGRSFRIRLRFRFVSCVRAGEAKLCGCVWDVIPPAGPSRCKFRRGIGRFFWLIARKKRGFYAIACSNARENCGFYALVCSNTRKTHGFLQSEPPGLNLQPFWNHLKIVEMGPCSHVAQKCHELTRYCKSVTWFLSLSKNCFWRVPRSRSEPPGHDPQILAFPTFGEPSEYLVNTLVNILVNAHVNTPVNPLVTLSENK